MLCLSLSPTLCCQMVIELNMKKNEIQEHNTVNAALVTVTFKKSGTHIFCVIQSTQGLVSSTFKNTSQPKVLNKHH